jgi:3-phenylpropionate/trans-cinnamate dioxygenase ferredoxin reductase subunit
VVTGSGQRIEASRLIFAIGVDPANALLRRAGATIRNGICVDERMRTSLADVYAVGDVCGLPENGHWLTAAAQGSTLGRRLAGFEEATDDEPEATLAGFHIRMFDVRLHAIGDFASEMDDVEIDGSIDRHRMLATLSRRGVVVAGIALNQPPSALDRIRGLIRSAASEASEADETGRLTTRAVRVPMYV